MSSYTEVRIGDVTYGGSQQGRYDPQASLFNSTDLIKTGAPNESDFQHVYRITVGELRRRLEALGLSLEAIRVSVAGALAPLLATLTNEDPDIPYRAFLEFACAQSAEDLIQSARDWRSAQEQDRSSDTPLEPWAQIDLNNDNFPEALLEFLQGGTPFLVPSDQVVLNGPVFERLLCEVFDDDALYEFDMTQVIQAGYFEGIADPVGNSFDKNLAMRDPDAFVMGATLREEESETLEFKSITSANVCESIASQVDKYIIGFMNQTGGRILFGISDDGRVEGVGIRRDQRDELHRRINAACVDITPSVALRNIEVIFRPVIGAAHYLSDHFVVEIAVPQGPPHEMFFRKEKTWVRFGKETRTLTGHALFTHILSAYRGVLALDPRLSSSTSSHE